MRGAFSLRVCACFQGFAFLHHTGQMAAAARRNKVLNQTRNAALTY
jgi:hypothetical protein